MDAQCQFPQYGMPPTHEVIDLRDRLAARRAAIAERVHAVMSHAERVKRRRQSVAAAEPKRVVAVRFEQGMFCESLAVAILDDGSEARVPAQGVASKRSRWPVVAVMALVALGLSAAGTIAMATTAATPAASEGGEHHASE